MDFDKDIRRTYSRQNYVAKVSLVMLFVFCIVGFLLGIVFIYKNLNHRLLLVEEALLGKNKAEDRDNLSPAWNNPVTTATTKVLSNEESLIHDLKKQGHTIKAKLEEIDKNILDLNPRITEERKLTRQKLQLQKRQKENRQINMELNKI